MGSIKAAMVTALLLALGATASPVPVPVPSDSNLHKENETWCREI